ncbi:MAG: ATP-binding protein [Flavobacteriaceae bacterium]|nr:ATP-binding protein [Flavobacteriaceae bacterium]
MSVRDEGIGIPEEEQKHMFERFFRANNATNIQGTGLGLNITKKYIDLMRGSITFNSEEGKGTTFIVAIPQSKDTNE